MTTSTRQCPMCDEIYFAWRTHKCDPLYQVHFDDPMIDDEDFDKIRASSVEQAAEIFCDRWDANGDYAIVTRGHADVIVIDPDGTRHAVFVQAQAIPEYHARQVRQPDHETDDQ